MRTRQGWARAGTGRQWGPPVSAFGPAPGPSTTEPPRRPPSYLPPGGLGSPSGRTAARRYAVTASHRPGIIPLKPLGVGDVFDAATKHTRRNPGTVLGLSALTNAAALVPAVLVGILVLSGTWFQRSGASAVVNPQTAGTLLLLAGTAYASFALTGVLALAVGEAILGRRVEFTEARRAVGRRLLAIVAAALVPCAVLTVPWVVFVFGLALASRGSDATVVFSLLMLGGIVAVTVTWLLPKVILTPPALMLEGLGVRAAVRRAWRLSQGRYWSILFVTLLAGALGTLLFFVLQLPLALVGSLLVNLLNLPYQVRAGGWRHSSRPCRPSARRDRHALPREHRHPPVRRRPDQ